MKGNIRIVLSLFGLLLFSIDLKSQLPIELLNFEAEKQKDLYLGISNDTNNIELIFKMFLNANKAIDSVETSASLLRVKKLANSIELEKKYIKKPEKRAEIIHKALHSEMFKQYVLNATPEMIDSNGAFNCVTGTIYSIYLSHQLGLKCKVIEEPNHVYPVVEVLSKDYPIETTDAQFGSIKYPDNYKKELIENLINYKLINLEDFENKDYNSIFDQIYRNKRTLSLIQTLAFQFYNQGVFATEDENIQKAVNEFAKAYGLFQDNQVKFALIGALLANINETKLDENGQKSFKLLCHFSSDDFLESIISPTFGYVAKRFLIDDNNIDTYVKLSEYLLNNTTDSLAYNELAFMYYSNLSHYHNSSGKFEKALNFSEKAIEIKPDQLVAIEIYIQSIVNYITTESPSEDFIKSIISKHKTYPRLADLYDYRRMVEGILADNVMTNIGERKLNLAVDSMTELLLFREGLEPTLSDYQIAELHKAISLSNFEAGKTSIAKKYISKALELIPNNAQYKNLKRVYSY